MASWAERLHGAVAKGNEVLVKEILEEIDGIRESMDIFKGRTSLHVACRIEG